MLFRGWEDLEGGLGRIKNYDIMEDVYRTIDCQSEGLYKEKGSRFIGLAYPISSEEDVRAILADLKEKYYDARHRCYAWRLGTVNPMFRCNDDGEPSSTAGKPILGQILSHELTDVLIVVIRYFGGTKLGVSGLISAYREAAADAIEQAIVVERTVNESLRIRFSYLVMNDVMKIVKEEEPEVVDRCFELDCEMTLVIRQRDFSTLCSRLKQVESLVFLNEE